MANFIGLVYATLKNEGVDTKGMSTDEAVKKYNELQEKSGGKAGEKEGTPAENKRLAETRIEDGGEEGEQDWVKTPEDKKVWNSLSDDDKYLLTMSSDMGFWYDEVLDNEEVYEHYQDLADKFSKSKKDIKIENEIDYDNVRYPEGTSKEYTMKVNDKYEKALPIIEKLGISVDDFGGKQSKEGGFEDNTEKIMQKYVFEPFNKKYPKGNNEAWDREFQPIYDAIEAVSDKNYNDWWIKNK